MPDTYNDLQIVHQYVDEITTFILGIVEDESVAVVLACNVFEKHKKRQDKIPFDSETQRITWLMVSARNTAIDYFRQQRNAEIKTQAIRKAIHDHP